MIEVPTWAWGLIVTALVGGFTTIGKMLSHYATRLEARMDRTEARIEATEKRTSELETRVRVLELHP